LNPAVPAVPQRFHTLDAARGLAALSVVVWHWQNFFLVGSTMPRDFDRTVQPLYGWIEPLYVAGDTAVDLFFALSGFVFFWMYAQRVEQGQVTGWRFFVLRFSRLYPLHLATLLFVALGQALYEARTGLPFVYPHNDVGHFLLHLGLLSSVGLEAGHGFNAPVWSVSVEAVLYLLFFLFCRWVGVRALWMLGLSLLGFFVVSRLYLPLGRGVGSFFAGGCVFLAYGWILRRPDPRPWLRAVVVTAVLAWTLTLGLLYAGIGPEQSRLLALLRWKGPVMLLFPLTLLALALAETWRPRMGVRLSWLGDISYSSYLLHFPLQLACAGAVLALGIDGRIYESPWLLLGFFAVLLLLSRASYRWFERPLQDRLRRRFAPAA
jgi:peptidoglycan/LPS O-acetylase OafA/YrhL